MKTARCCIILFICLCLGQLYAQTYDNIRMAYIATKTDVPIATKFYERARANGFNYILAEFWLEDSSQWDKSTGHYTGGADSALRKQLKNEFIAADQKGLKLIPKFQTSSKHSEHWKHVNNHIQWQELPANVPQWIPDTTWDKAVKIVPTFAPDLPGENGFDTSFNELLKVIYSAFEDARPSLSYGNLDYIHFGADEPFFVYELGSIYKVFVMAGLCQRDRDWLRDSASHASTVQERTIALLGSNIKRKVEMIRAAGLSRWPQHNTNALYYADMLDPNHLGGENKYLCAFTDPTASADTTNIKTYRMTESTYIRSQSVLNHSIAVQWSYEREYAQKDYDTDSTFRYFKNNDLKFLHGNALADGADPITNDRMHQLMEQAVVSTKPEYKNHVMGFVSFHWCIDDNIYSNAWSHYDQIPPSYRTMEFLSHILWHNAALYE